MRRIVLMLLVMTVCMAASAQNAKTLYEQGKALYDAKDYAKAFPKLKAAAEKGNKKAQYRVGRCYEKGKGVAKDEAVAFQWYSKGAAQEHAKSEYAVGKCYKDGIGVKKDRKKAFSFFMRSARQDYAEAQYQVGKSYLKGKGTEADAKKAKSWLVKAVKNPKDGEEVLKKIRKDAADGDEDARTMLKLIN